jgi:hypothetical protein
MDDELRGMKELIHGQRGPELNIRIKHAENPRKLSNLKKPDQESLKSLSGRRVGW